MPIRAAVRLLLKTDGAADALFVVLVDCRMSHDATPLPSPRQVPRADGLPGPAYRHATEWLDGLAREENLTATPRRAADRLLCQLAVDAAYTAWQRRSHNKHSSSSCSSCSGPDPSCCPPPLRALLHRRWPETDADFCDHFAVLWGLEFAEAAATQPEGGPVAEDLPGARQLRAAWEPHEAHLQCPSLTADDPKWRQALGSLVAACQRPQAANPGDAAGRGPCGCGLCYAAAKGDLLVAEAILGLLELRQSNEAANEEGLHTEDRSGLLAHLARAVHAAVLGGHSAVASRIARVWIFSRAHPALWGRAPWPAAPCCAVDAELWQGPHAVLWGRVAGSPARWAAYVSLCPAVAGRGGRAAVFTAFLWQQVTLLYARSRRGAQAHTTPLWSTLDSREHWSSSSSSSSDEEEEEERALFRSLGCLRDLFAYYCCTTPEDGGGGGGCVLTPLPLGAWFWAYWALTRPLSGRGGDEEADSVSQTLPDTRDSTDAEARRPTVVTWLACLAAASPSGVALAPLRLLAQCVEDLAGPTRWGLRLTLGEPPSRHLRHPSPPFFPELPGDSFTLQRGTSDITATRAIRLGHPPLLRLLLVSGLATVELVSPARIRQLYAALSRRGASSSTGPPSSSSSEEEHNLEEVHSLLCWATGLRRDRLQAALDAEEPPLQQLPGVLLKMLDPGGGGGLGSGGSSAAPPIQLAADLIDVVTRFFRRHCWRCWPRVLGATGRDILLRACLTVLELAPFQPVAWLMALYILYDARGKLEPAEAEGGGSLAHLAMCRSAGHPQRIAWLQRAVEVRRLVWEYETCPAPTLGPPASVSARGPQLPHQDSGWSRCSEDSGWCDVDTERHSEANQPDPPWSMADSRQLLNDVVRMRCSHLFATSAPPPTSPRGSREKGKPPPAPVPPVLPTRPKLHPASDAPSWCWHWARHSVVRPLHPTAPEPTYVKIMTPADLPPCDPHAPGTWRQHPPGALPSGAGVFVRLPPHVDLWRTLERCGVASGVLDVAVPLGMPLQRGDMIVFRRHEAPPVLLATSSLSSRFLVASDGEPVRCVRLPCVLDTGREGRVCWRWRSGSTAAANSAMRLEAVMAALGEAARPDPLFWWRGTDWDAARAAGEAGPPHGSVMRQLQRHRAAVERWLALESGFRVGGSAAVGCWDSWVAEVSPA